MKQTLLTIKTAGRGMYLITDQLRQALDGLLPEVGLLNVFIQHTSASLLIQENADPSARRDLEEFFDRLAPQGETWHRHTAEGPDDTTSHFKSALSDISLMIPVRSGTLALGTWQGVYLFEHRDVPHERRLLLTVLS